MKLKYETFLQRNTNIFSSERLRPSACLTDSEAGGSGREDLRDSLTLPLFPSD